MNRRLVLLALAIPLLVACTDRATQERLNQQDARINELEKRVDELQKQVDQQHADPLGSAMQALAPLIAPMPPTPAPAAATNGARCTPDGSGYAITKNDFGSLFDDTPSFASEARIVPNFADGKPDGFKLFAIRPDSVLASCGLHNGDVVRMINGMTMSSPDKALEVYSKVRAADHVDLAVVRQGAPLTIHLRVR